MITAVLPTDRKKLNWKEFFKVKEDYEAWILSGMYHVHFQDDDEEIRNWYLKELEKEKGE